MSLIVHRAPRADHLADGLAELLRDAAGRPVRPGAGAGPGARGRALAQPAALPPAGSRRGPRRRGLRRRRVPVAGQPGRRGHRHARERPVGAGRPGLAAARRWSTPAPARPGARTLSTHLGHGQEGEEARAPARAPLRRRPAAGRGCSRRTPYSGPTLLADWERHDDTDGAGGALPTDLTWQPELWRRLVAEVGEPTPGAAARRVVEALRRGAGADRPARRGSRCSGTPGSPSPRWSCSPRSVSTATSTCGCPTRRRRSGSSLVGTDRRRARAEPTTPTCASATRCSPRSAGTCASSSAPCSSAPRGSDDHRQRSRRRAASQHRPARLAAARHRGQRRCRTASARALDPADRSVQVHACHGPARQVEVLREVLLGLLADDPPGQPPSSRATSW